MSSQLTGYGNRRRELDFYPTPPEATIALMDFLHLEKPMTVWEPACGDGSMSKVIESYGHKVFSSDINTSYGDKRDFFDARMLDYKVDAIITNPPFNLSLRFIEKSLGCAPLVAMLLKSQYWHAKARLSFFYRNPPTFILPLTWRPDFMNGERGGRPTMEVAWTVWKQCDDSARYFPLAKPILK